MDKLHTSNSPTAQQQRDARRDLGNYIAGFVDGEGHFGLADRPHGGSGGIAARAHFAVSLRADDVEILRLIQRAIGVGTIGSILKKAGGASPQTSLRCHKLADLQTIVVPFFTEFPLRAKKARDFGI